MHSHFAGDMSKYHVIILQLHPKHCIGKRFQDHSFDLDRAFFSNSTGRVGRIGLLLFLFGPAPSPSSGATSTSTPCDFATLRTSGALHFFIGNREHNGPILGNRNRVLEMRRKLSVHRHDRPLVFEQFHFV